MADVLVLETAGEALAVLVNAKYVISVMVATSTHKILGFASIVLGIAGLLALSLAAGGVNNEIARSL